MSTTTYTQIDFTNITALTNDFVNAGPNVGTAPNLTTSGLDAAGFSLATPTPTSALGESKAQVKYQFELDHTTPSNPIPATAQISQIKISQQVTNASAAASVDAAFDSSSGSTDVASDVHVFLNENNPSWIATDNSIDAFDFDFGSGGGNQSLSKNAGPISRLIEVVYNIAALPGDFPLGYMTKAEFVAAFTTLVVEYYLDAVSGAALGSSTSAPGSYSDGVDITAVNLQIEVTWTDPVTTNWDVADFDPENNILTLERPDPGVPPEDDDELPETLFIDDEEYEPEDFWIILWTRVRIIVRLKPTQLPPTPPVEMIFAGTQFSGRVSLGTFSITQVDLSGVYELDPDAHDDTLYIRDGTTVTTEARMIPSPFFLTYFVDNRETDVLHYNGTRMRVTGVGDLQQMFQSLDAINTEELTSETLRTINNLSPFHLANFIDQNCALRVYTSNTGDFMNVSQLSIFWKKLYTGYPQ